jgi:hypothetical protein
MRFYDTIFLTMKSKIKFNRKERQARKGFYGFFLAGFAVQGIMNHNDRSI